MLDNIDPRPWYESLRLFTRFGLDLFDWAMDRRWAPVLVCVAWPNVWRVRWVLRRSLR